MKHMSPFLEWDLKSSRHSKRSRLVRKTYVTAHEPALMPSVLTLCSSLLIWHDADAGMR